MMTGKTKIYAFAALLLALQLLIITPKVQARSIQANNSYVVLSLPKSFKSQHRFAGFFSRDAGATIMVLDLPREAYSQFTHRFERELANKGYSEVRREKLNGRHDEHLFFFARQHTPVGQFDKYLLIFRNQERAAYVTITVNPIEQVETPLSYIGAKNILAKASLASKRARAAKNYYLDYMGAFVERSTIAGSTTIFALKQPRAPKKRGKPLFVIAPSISRHKLTGLKDTGRKLMANFARFRKMKLTAEEDLMVDGMQGYGLSATAINKSDGKPVGIYQLVLANPKGGYFRIVGVAPRPQFAHYLPEYRRMAASFHLTTPLSE